MRSPKVPWWPGSIVSEGGVHVHHLAFGIMAMMIAGARRVHGPRRAAPTPTSAPSSSASGWADDRRVRALDLPRRRLLGRGGTQLDRRDRDRRLGDVPDPDRGQPLQLRNRRRRDDHRAASLGAALLFALVAICFFKQRVMHGIDRLLRPPDRDLRRLPDRQAGLPLGAPPLRRAASEEAGEGRGALPPRPPHRALQERLPRHRRRQAERGHRRGHETRSLATRRESGRRTCATWPTSHDPASRPSDWERTMEHGGFGVRGSRVGGRRRRDEHVGGHRLRARPRQAATFPTAPTSGSRRCSSSSAGRRPCARRRASGSWPRERSSPARPAAPAIPPADQSQSRLGSPDFRACVSSKALGRPDRVPATAAKISRRGRQLGHVSGAESPTGSRPTHEQLEYSRGRARREARPAGRAQPLLRIIRPIWCPSGSANRRDLAARDVDRAHHPGPAERPRPCPAPPRRPRPGRRR